MADETYTPKTYRKNGGDIFVVASGGQVLVESGGTVVVESGGDITLESGGGVVLEPGGLLQAPEVANANIIGGIPVIHRILIPDGAGDTNVVLTHKTRVIDMWAQKTAADGGASDTVQLKNGSDAITDALDMNVVDKTLVRAGTIDDSKAEIAAAGTLKVTAATGTNNACIVYVLGVRVA